MQPMFNAFYFLLFSDLLNDTPVDHRPSNQTPQTPQGKLQPDVHLAAVHEDPWAAADEVAWTGNWLSDRHIDHAQHLLGSTFSSVSGFQSTVIFDSKNCVHVQAPMNKFVQILNVHNNHWLTISNTECNNNTVKVYNSMSSSGLQHSEEFNCQVAALLNCKSPEIRVENANIKQQKGYSDWFICNCLCH